MSTKEIWADAIRQVREINLRINEFGVSEYQRLKLIDLLTLELENREAMLSIRGAVQPFINNHEELYALEKDNAKQRYFDTLERDQAVDD